MRIALSVCIVVGSTLIGKALASAAHRRAATLKGLSEGLRILRVHMTSMFEPVQNSLVHSECSLLRQVGEQMRDGMSAGAAWEAIKPRVRRTGGAADALVASDERVLDRLFSRLGGSGREAQEILLTETLQSLERLQEAARAKAVEADRLYVTLGLLIGLMLALIVI